MSKEEPLVVSDEQLIRLLKDANKKLGDHARLLTEQLSASQKREVMLRQELLHYGEHEGSCSIVDLDADGFHCECDCGLAAILAATADLENVRLCEKEPRAWSWENKNVKGNWYLTWREPESGFNTQPLYRAWKPK